MVKRGEPFLGNELEPLIFECRIFCCLWVFDTLLSFSILGEFGLISVAEKGGDESARRCSTFF